MILKICGITRPADALYAVEHGATAVGFIFWPGSPRCVSAGAAAAIVRELPGDVDAVGVFVNQPVEEIVRTASVAGLTTIQLHGDELPAVAAAFRQRVWRAASLSTIDTAVAAWPEHVTLLLDACDSTRRGGTGITIDWQRAATVAARRPVVLAGGLTPANVEAAIAAVRPLGVDVSSGVEEAPGVKDREKMARFLERARAGFHAH